MQIVTQTSGLIRYLVAASEEVTDFDFEFRIWQASQVQVFVNDVEVNPGLYSVENIETSGTANAISRVVFDPAVTDCTVTLRRAIAAEPGIEYAPANFISGASLDEEHGRMYALIADTQAAGGTLSLDGTEVDMGSRRLTSIAAGVAESDAATVAQVNAVNGVTDDAIVTVEGRVTTLEGSMQTVLDTSEAADTKATTAMTTAESALQTDGTSPMTGDLVIEKDWPQISLRNTASSLAANTVLFGHTNAGAFRVENRDANGAFLSHNYIMPRDENGALSHDFYVGGALAGRIDAGGLSTSGDKTFLTREKADERYVAAGTSPDFGPTITSTGVGPELSLVSTNSPIASAPAVNIKQIYNGTLRFYSEDTGGGATPLYEIRRDQETGGALSHGFKLGDGSANAALIDGTLQYGSNVVTRALGDERYVKLEDYTPGMAVAGVCQAFESVAAVEAANVSSTVSHVQTMVHTEEVSGGGAMYRRVTATEAARWPARAVIRSLDRITPSGTTDATAGGYWLLAGEVQTMAMFGAINDANRDPSTGEVIGTDSAEALSHWAQYLRKKSEAAGPVRPSGARFVAGFGSYVCNGTLDLSSIGLVQRNMLLDFYGCTLMFKGADSLGVDLTDSESWHLFGGAFQGCPVDTPVCGVKTGRKADNDTAGRWIITGTTTRATGSTAAPSCFRIAALWNLSSETIMENHCLWENYYETGDVRAGFGAAYDGANVLAYSEPFTITSISKAAPGWVTVSDARDLANSDHIVFGNLSGMPELEGKLFRVRSLSGNSFLIEDMSNPDPTNRVDTSGFASFNGGKLYREDISPTVLDDTSRLTPYQRTSFKHGNRYNCTYASQRGGGAVYFAYAGDPTHFYNCFMIGSTGFWVDLVAEADLSMSGCTFDIHLERGAGFDLATDPIRWQWRIQTLEPGTYQEMHINKCYFSDPAARPELMFRVVTEGGEGITHVLFNQCEFLFPRLPEEYGEFINLKNGTEFRDCQMIIDRMDGLETVEKSGTFTELSTGQTHHPRKSYTRATLPSAGLSSGAIELVTDSPRTPSNQLVRSTGSSWAYVSDGAAV